MIGILGTIREYLNGVRALDVAVVDGDGNQLTGFDSTRPDTAALSNVPQSATSVVLAAANPARRRLVIVNDGTKNLRVAFAATATATAYTHLLVPKAVYDGPLNDYTGDIAGIWEGAGGGAARVTEITT